MTYYTIAGHSIVDSGNTLNRITSFLPFVSTENTDKTLVLQLQTGIPMVDGNIVPFSSQPFVGDDTICSIAFKDNTYILKYERLTISPILMEITNHDGRFCIKTNMDEHTSGDIMRWCFLRPFVIAFLFHKTVSIHASVVTYKGKAVIFLGDSGTGKSTQSRLWLENIPDTELLNDDTPLIRVMDDQTISVFGAPWSGKTPCYKNKSAPIAAIVRLSQAPHNQIKRLDKFAALGALLHSCPKSLRLDETLLDHITAIFSAVLKQVPVYHFECLPNADAARLVFKTVFED